MKQRITKEQIEELSDKAKERLREWWQPAKGDFICGDGEVFTGFETQSDGEDFEDFNTYDQIGDCYLIDPPEVHVDMYMRDIVENKTILPLLSISQMIELLDEHSWKTVDSIEFNREDFMDVMSDVCKALRKNSPDDVVFELWDAVKEVLER